MVRIETSPEDLAGMSAAEGILTARGGMTSHAAVVARVCIAVISGNVIPRRQEGHHGSYRNIS